MPSVSFCQIEFNELVKEIHRAAQTNDPDLMGTFLDSLMVAGRDYQEAVQVRTDHQAAVNARMLPRIPMTIAQMAEAGRLSVLVGGESPSD